MQSWLCSIQPRVGERWWPPTTQETSEGPDDRIPVSGRNGALVLSVLSPSSAIPGGTGFCVRDKEATHVACMPVVMWTKLGVEYRYETDDLSAEAFALHTCALILSNEQGYDLVIPKRKIWQLGPRATDDAVAELLSTGWWTVDGAAYDISAYRPEWQVPKRVVEHRRKLNAERQDRKRRHDAGDHSRCLETCSYVKDVTRYEPSDEPRDPGRNGTGRNGTLGLEESEANAEQSNWPPVAVPDPELRVCESCGRTSGFLDGGRCRREDCRRQRAA